MSQNQQNVPCNIHFFKNWIKLEGSGVAYRKVKSLLILLMSEQWRTKSACSKHCSSAFFATIFCFNDFVTFITCPLYHLFSLATCTLSVACSFLLHLFFFVSPVTVTMHTLFSTIAHCHTCMCTYICMYTSYFIVCTCNSTAVIW